MNNFKLDNWVKDILVDPLSKDKLYHKLHHLYASYGRKYPIINGIPDLRFLNNETTTDQKKWKHGQIEFKKQERKIAHKDNINHSTNIESMAKIYTEIPIEGDCLDVGGHQGRLRKFLDPKYKYITCDPFLNVFDNINNQPKLLTTYPFLIKPVNFICCDSEFLPFESSYFQTVHMRSVIDHFVSPELALNEAYRVLKHEGQLIIGTFVSGIKFSFVTTKRNILSSLGLKKYKDYHIWHPSYDDLISLILSCGFKIEKVCWQENHDAVCFISARKQSHLMRKSNEK